MLSVRFGNTDLGFARGEGLWAAFHLFQKANQSTATGTAQLLEWITSSGNTVRLTLDPGTGPSVFQRGYFSRMTCVAEITK
jgi:type VI protein secretion system component VasK